VDLQHCTSFILGGALLILAMAPRSGAIKLCCRSVYHPSKEGYAKRYHHLLKILFSKSPHISKRSEPSAYLPLFGEIIGSYATAKSQ
jgi:hypothetical protein